MPWGSIRTAATSDSGVRFCSTSARGVDALPSTGLTAMLVAFAGCVCANARYTETAVTSAATRQTRNPPHFLPDISIFRLQHSVRSIRRRCGSELELTETRRSDHDRSISIQQVDCQRGRPAEIARAIAHPGARIVILTEPLICDQADSPLRYLACQLRVPVILESMDHHPVDVRPYRTEPVIHGIEPQGAHGRRRDREAV